jgi:type I restriction enzyme S subunit
MSWELKSFDELGFIGRGKSRHRPRNDESLYGGEFPLIQTGDVKNANLYITEYSQTYSQKGLDQSKLWEPNTLCITIAANIADTTILGIQACFPDSIIGFVADENVCDVRFIKYHFDIVQKQMQMVSQGATQDNLSLEKLLKFKVATPPLETQKRIASILCNYDDLIENNLKRIKLLEETAQNIYKEWFVNFRFPNYEHTAFDAISGLPAGWEMKKLSELIILTMGQSPKSEFYNENKEGLPFHQGVTGYGHRFVSHSTYCSFATRIAEEGDILFSVRAPVGRLNIAPERLIIGRGLSSIRNKRNCQSFQLYQLKNHFFQEDLIGGGAIFNSVTKNDLENQLMISPLNEVVDEFERIVKPIDEQIWKLNLQNQKLKEARDIMLPRLMNRTIEV